MISLAEQWVAHAIGLRDEALAAEKRLMASKAPEIRSTPIDSFGKPVSVVLARIYEGPDHRPRCAFGESGISASAEDALRIADWLYEMFGAGRLPDAAHWLDCAHWVSGRCSCRTVRGEPK